jgi:hypothetical protein
VKKLERKRGREGGGYLAALVWWQINDRSVTGVVLFEREITRVRERDGGRCWVLNTEKCEGVSHLMDDNKCIV